MKPKSFVNFKNMILFLQSLHTMCSILRDKDHKLQSVDLSGNELTAEHIQFIKMSLAANKSLISLDLRRNPGFSAGNIIFFFRIFIFLNISFFQI
jgi:hypothetical protein